MTNLYLEIEQKMIEDNTLGIGEWDCPLKDSEFLEIDDKLYSLIQDTLKDYYYCSINEDEDLFNWYCKIRDKLCKEIHKKRVGLI